MVAGDPSENMISADSAPAISVVIPAYNEQDMVSDSIRSVQAQSFSDFEIIVVDDGSQDETPEVVNALAAEDSRIRLVQRKNGGLPAARNSGLAAARAEWVCFLDADDFLLSSHLADAAALFGDDIDLVYAGGRRTWPNGVTSRVEEPVQIPWKQAVATHNPFYVHMCTVRTSAAREINGFDESLRSSEDWDFWRRLAATHARAAATRKATAIYRMRAASMSRQLDGMLESGLKVLAKRPTDNPELFGQDPVRRSHIRLLTWLTGAAAQANADISSFVAALPAMTADEQISSFVEPLLWGAVHSSGVGAVTTADVQAPGFRRAVDAIADLLERANVPAAEVQRFRSLLATAELDLHDIRFRKTELPEILAQAEVLAEVASPSSISSSASQRLEDELLQAAVRHLTARHGIAVDVGAMQGRMLRFFERNVWPELVVGFEPVDDLYAALINDFEANKFRLSDKVLGAETTEVDFRTYVDRPRSSGLIDYVRSEESWAGKHVDQTKPQSTLDAELSALSIDPTAVKVILVDLLNGGWTVVEGASTTLKAGRPLVFLRASSDGQPRDFYAKSRTDFLAKHKYAAVPIVGPASPLLAAMDFVVLVPTEREQTVGAFLDSLTHTCLERRGLAATSEAVSRRHA